VFIFVLFEVYDAATFHFNSIHLLHRRQQVIANYRHALKKEEYVNIEYVKRHGQRIRNINNEYNATNRTA
jgi:hypothetical protein